MRQFFHGFCCAVIALAASAPTVLAQQALQVRPITTEMIRATARAAAVRDTTGLNASANAIYTAAGKDNLALSTAVGTAVGQSQQADIPRLVAAFIVQSKPIVPPEPEEPTAAVCSTPDDTPEARKVAAEIIAAITASPSQAAAIATEAAAGLHGLGPVIAGAAAKAAPAAAIEIASSMTRILPKQAALIAARIASAVPVEAAAIAVAVLQALPPDQLSTAETRQIATCIGEAVPDAADLVTAAIDPGILGPVSLDNPLPIVSPSSPR